jgi:DnaJ family protein C protein 11
VYKTAYDVAVTAGTAASQLRLSVVQPVVKGVKGTFQISLSTASGMKSSFLVTKRITKLTKITMGVQVATAMGVTFQLRFRRLGRRLAIPILLSDEIRANIIAGALLIPLIGSALIDIFYLEPRKKAAIKKRLEELRETNSLVLNQRKKEAEEERQLMQASMIKKVDQEIEKNGLVIVKAIYGILPPSKTRPRSQSITQRLSPFSQLLYPNDSSQFIDITIPIQNLVTNSQLFISGGFSKSNMIGFYDPCLGEKKRLRIEYRFQERMHWVEIGDRETLALPLREHQIS